MTSLEIPTTEETAEGGSRFGTTSVALEPQVFAPPAPAFDLSEPMSAERVVWFSVPGGWVGDWHPTPRNQLYVQMEGRLEVSVTTGEQRVLGAGDVLWITDTGGAGHRSRVVGDRPAVGLFVQLPDDNCPA